MSNELRSDFYRINWNDICDIEGISAECPDEAVSQWWDATKDQWIEGTLPKVVEVIGYTRKYLPNHDFFLVESGEVLEVDVVEWITEMATTGEYDE